jgi:hypothetical protein
MDAAVNSKLNSNFGVSYNLFLPTIILQNLKF